MASEDENVKPDERCENCGSSLLAVTRSTLLGQHHATLDQFTKDLTSSLKSSFPDRSLPYARVFVLLLRWAEDDLGTKKETDMLEHLFRTKFKYETETAVIPSENSQLKLSLIASQFVYEHDDKSNLLIIYYGGHGVEQESNKSIWAARKRGGPTADWSSIQSSLINAKSDILFILDCCYAATAATRGTIPGSKEVLAACSVESVTTGVHDNSFTQVLIRELRKTPMSGIAAWQLHGKMMSLRGSNELSYTPNFFPLSSHDGTSIRLRPLLSGKYISPASEQIMDPIQDDVEMSSNPPSLYSGSSLDSDFNTRRILLAVHLKDWNAPPSVEQWTSWIKQGAPGNIAEMYAWYQSGQRGTGGLLTKPEIGLSEDDSWNPFSPRYIDSQRGDLGDTAIYDPDFAAHAPQIVRTEGTYPSMSTLLLVSVPLPIWSYLPANPAYSFVGYIEGENALNQPGLPRTNSNPIKQKLADAEQVVKRFDRQHAWYRYYVITVIMGVQWFSWYIVPLKGLNFLVSQLLIAVLAVAVPATNLFEDGNGSGYVPRNLSLSEDASDVGY